MKLLWGMICAGMIFGAYGCTMIRSINKESQRKIASLPQGRIYGSQKSICLIVNETSELICSGYNDSWQIGNQTVTQGFVHMNTPEPVIKSNSTRFLAQNVALGKNFGAAIEKGTVKRLWFWGIGAHNIKKSRESSPAMLASDPASAVPIQFSDAKQAQEIAANDTMLCFRWSKTLKCIGESNNGETGVPIGSEPNPNIAYQISDNVSHFAIATGALCWSEKSAGFYSIKCNGKINEYLNGPGSGTTTQTVASGLTSVSQLAVSGKTLCYLQNAGIAGALYCWGGNFEGQLTFSPSDFNRSVDEILVYGSGVMTVSASEDGHFCVLLTNGSSECWGKNTAGELGISLNHAFSFSQIPLSVPGKIDQVIAVNCSTLAHTEAGVLTVIGSFGCGDSDSGAGSHGAGSHGAGSH